MNRLSLPDAVKRLQAEYGRPKSPEITDPWHLILWENVAYLADDERRQSAFRELEASIGTRPEKILAATKNQLVRITSHGILAAQFAEKLRRCAQIVLQEFDGDLRPVLRWPALKAKRALQKFPGIGEPGAEKILLFARSYPVLALESNGLRVLLRLGFGKEHTSYSTTYRAVQQAVADELKKDYAWLIAAHQLVRRHGQELCRRNQPLCEQCPLAQGCQFYRNRV